MKSTSKPHQRLDTTQRLVAAMLIGVFCAVLSPAIKAQFAYHNPLREITTTTKISAGDLRVIQRVLGLDAEQRAMLDDLRAAWLAEFTDGHRTATAEAVAMIDEALITGRHGSVSRAGDIVRAWNKRAAELEARFIEDIRLAVITAEQDALWPIAERELRRIEQLPIGRLVGEQVDLTRLVDEVYPDWHNKPAMVEALNEYAVRFDEAIRARMALLTSELHREYSNKVRTADGESARPIYDRALVVRQRVQRVNESHRRNLAALLPDDEARARFDQAYIDAGLSGVVRSFSITKRIEVVQELPTLTGEQRRGVEAAIARYAERRAANRRTLFEGVHHSQGTTLPNSLAEALAPPSQGGGIVIDGVLVPARTEFNPGRDERVDAARETLLTTEQQLLRELLELLTTEQRLSLPLPSEEYFFLLDHRHHGL